MGSKLGFDDLPSGIHNDADLSPETFSPNPFPLDHPCIERILSSSGGPGAVNTVVGRRWPGKSEEGFAKIAVEKAIRALRVVMPAISEDLSMGWGWG